ncbi:MAG: hypothetical protein HYW24_00570 [Candidatus Aenigmarchaeota archaeon]|nr:hypothetical protein [Candidatus Aenigmarchaeota archaeon]
MSVPRSATGGFAEKAKACWDNPFQGTRQISCVTSEEAVPVVFRKGNCRFQ